MKNSLSYFIFFTLIIGFSSSLLAQGQGSSNGFEVTQIVAPVSSFNYELNDSSDFIIQVRNQGPNAIIAGDLLKISYSIFGASGGNNQSYDTNIRVGKAMPVGAINRYTLHEKIALGNSNENFTACSDISGSAIYPVNSNKFPGKCTPFIVSVSKNKLDLNDVYYAEGMVYFSLNSTESITAEVFDITGKSLKKINLAKTAKQSFPLSISAKGFYFMKVYNNSGSATTVKFVVNQ